MTTNIQTTRRVMLTSLQSFVRQRPGFDPNNYGDGASYRADVRRAGRDLRDAQELIRAVAVRPYCVINPKQAGRLSWDAAKQRWDYTTGQYFPTEYRAAACAVLASALWDYFASDLPERKLTKTPNGEMEETYNGISAGGWIRRQARIDLGPRLARRWFS